MTLRKNRVHYHGTTNLDFRTSSDFSMTDTTKFEKNRIELLSTPHKNFSDILKSKLNKTAPNPFLNSTLLYKEAGKTPKSPTLISSPREKQLEKAGRNIFNGDSNVLYDERIYSNYSFQKTLANEKKLPSLIKTKHEKHGEAIHETQLVGVGEFNTETLEGKIDIEKIKEIRRILRRKYGGRGNFQKIFNCWDEEHNGAVSSKNIYDMVKRFGININFDEARVLVASADHDRSNDLNLDEFLELIFTDNEALKVDLQKIPIASEREKTVVSNMIYNELLESKMKKHQENVNLILRNKLSQISRACLDCDFLRHGQIEKDKLFYYMRQLGFSEKVLPDSDIEIVFEKYKADENNFNYRPFLKDLKEFEYKSNDLRFEKQELLIQKPKEMKGLTDIQKRLMLYDTLVDPHDFVISDNQKIPVSKLISSRERAKKVFRALYKYIPSQKAFEENLNNFLTLKESTLLKENLINKNQLKDYISDFFESKPSERLDKGDLEGFLTNFIYNKHGETRLNEISSLIYEEEDRDYYKKLGYKTNGPPPSLKNKQCEEFNQAYKEMEPIANQTNVEFHHKSSINKNLDKILKKIEDRFFIGSTTALNVFRIFDSDNDGYVSQDNLIKKIKELSLLNNDELPYFLHYLDPQKKGYLDFHEFSEKIRPNALQTDEMGRQVIVSNLYPESEHTTYLKDALPSIRETIFANKKFFTPPANNELTKSTRFSATPLHKNTFTSFQNNYENSPMYVSAKDRFSKGLNANTAFQKEEKEKNKKVDLAHLESIRKYAKSLAERVDNQIVDSNKKLDHRLKMKGIAQWSYEHQNHLKNEWN